MDEIKRGRGRPPKIQNEPNIMVSTQDENIREPEYKELKIETIREPNDADTKISPKFDIDKITPEKINEIGRSIGFLMWDDLQVESKKFAWFSSTNNKYFSGSIYKKEGLPPLLSFKRVGKGEKNQYVLNLNTMRPTFNSIIKKQLSDNIINSLKY